MIKKVLSNNTFSPIFPPKLSYHFDSLTFKKVVGVFHKTDFIIAHYGGINFRYKTINVLQNLSRVILF